jgi:hypothetical protein
VAEVDECLDTLLDDGVRALSGNAGDKCDTASVVLESRIVEATEESLNRTLSVDGARAYGKDHGSASTRAGPQRPC